ncbi:MAG: glucose-1-phosphate thymidylyltransferase, partial [bacterium]|nr:glucose-1-phosphate thymidylyltransferase [bacterium]
VETIENRQGYKIACLEEIAYNNGWLAAADLKNAAELMKTNNYGQYLLSLI